MANKKRKPRRAGRGAVIKIGFGGLIEDLNIPRLTSIRARSFDAPSRGCGNEGREALTEALGGRWHKSGQYGLACCPSHDDRAPSLSIRDMNGKVLVRCHVQLRPGQDVIAALEAAWAVGERLSRCDYNNNSRPGNPDPQPSCAERRGA